MKGWLGISVINPKDDLLVEYPSAVEPASLQRLEDTRVLLDEARKSTEAKHVQFRSKLVAPKILKWMGTLDSATLSAYRKALNTPQKIHPWGGPWGSVIEIFVEAGTNDLDDMQAALVLFTSGIITPVSKSWAARTGTSTLAAYDDSAEYVTGLYDTLRYRPDRLPAEVCEALLISNVYRTSKKSRELISALITVTDALVQAEVADSLLTNEHYDESPPHQPYLSMNGRGSVWLRDDELSQYVLDRPADAGLIAGIIADRKSGDVGTIDAIMEHGVTAVSSGVL